MYIGGKQYRRLMDKNGKALNPDEERKEHAKVDQAVGQARKQSSAKNRRA